MYGQFSRRQKLFYLGIPLLLITILVIELFTNYHYSFNDKVFSADNAYAHIEELSSPAYAGRLAGTEGNELALNYVEEYFRDIGLEPGGENGSYYQNLRSMVPIENSPSYFQIIDDRGNVLQDYLVSEDYRQELNGYGGNGTVTAQLLYLDHYIRDYEPAELAGKVLVNRTMLSDKDMEYAIEHGVQGFIAISRDGVAKESSSLKDKQGITIPINLMDPASFTTLAEYAHEGRKVQLNTDFSFQLLSTPNLLGKIPGQSDDYIIISAHIDGLGQEGENYYPGALDGASGVGMVLELARTAQAQATPPEKTLIFALWNNQEHGLQGSSYYVENPIYPLAKTEVTVLNNLGLTDATQLYFDSNGELGEIQRNKLRSYTYEPYYDSTIRELTRELTAGKDNDHESFLEHGVPAVLVEQVNHYDVFDSHGTTLHTHEDTIAQIDKSQLSIAAEPLLTYLQIDGFGQMTPASFSSTELIVLIFLLIGAMLIYLIYVLQKFKPKQKIFKLSFRDLYHSLGYNLVIKTSYFLLLGFVIMLAIAFIAYLPYDFRLKIAAGEIHTNFSPAITLNKSMLYIQSLFTDGFGMSQGRTLEATVKVTDILSWSFFRSLKLVVAALLVAFTLGIIKGIFDGYRAKDKAVGSIAALSLPDILIVVLVQELLIFLGSHDFTALVRTDRFSQFLLPLICLAIIPTAYISRLTSTAVREEMKKDYIRAARAKGLSPFQIIYKHLLIGIIIKVIEALPALLTMILSNLMIIEYVYYYPGIIYNLFARYARHDPMTFIGLALSLGLMYVLLSSFTRLIAYLLNPLKREGKL